MAGQSSSSSNTRGPGRTDSNFDAIRPSRFSSSSDEDEDDNDDLAFQPRFRSPDPISVPKPARNDFGRIRRPFSPPPEEIDTSAIAAPPQPPPSVPIPDDHPSDRRPISEVSDGAGFSPHQLRRPSEQQTSYPAQRLYPDQTPIAIPEITVSEAAPPVPSQAPSRSTTVASQSAAPAETSSFAPSNEAIRSSDLHRRTHGFDYGEQHHQHTAPQSQMEATPFNHPSAVDRGYEPSPSSSYRCDSGGNNSRSIRFLGIMSLNINNMIGTVGCRFQFCPSLLSL